MIWLQAAGIAQWHEGKMALSPRAARRLWLTRDASRGGVQPVQRGPGHPTATAVDASTLAGPGALSCGGAAADRPGCRARAAVRADSPQEAELARLPSARVRRAVKDVGVQVTWPADTITYQSAIARDGQVQDAAVGDVPADTITYAGAIALTDGLGQASAAGDKVPHPANTITYDGSIAREAGQEAPAVGDVQATLSVDTITYNVAIARDGSEHGSTAGDVQETLQNDAISDSGAFALAREDHHEQDSAAGDVQTAHEDNGQVQASAVGDGQARPEDNISYVEAIARNGLVQAPAVGDVQAAPSEDTITYVDEIAREDGQVQASAAGETAALQATRPADTTTCTDAIARFGGQELASAVGDGEAVQVAQSSRRRWADYDDECSDGGDDGWLHDLDHHDDREAKWHMVVSKRSKGRLHPNGDGLPSEGARPAEDEGRFRQPSSPQARHRPDRPTPEGDRKAAVARTARARAKGRRP